MAAAAAAAASVNVSLRGGSLHALLKYVAGGRAASLACESMSPTVMTSHDVIAKAKQWVNIVICEGVNETGRAERTVTVALVGIPRLNFVVNKAGLTCKTV